MKAAGVDYELIAYPGVLHGFTEPEADARAKKYGLPLGYNAKADRASWASLLTLLSRRLDG
jgi:dienelactone hydrolase